MRERGVILGIRVGLHTADGTKFPNLALMKLSSWYKSRGDYVEWYNVEGEYDLVYSSKVFTFSPEPKIDHPVVICGGSGYGTGLELPQEVEHSCPDYDLYPTDYSLGFLTRGCNRKCKHCFVPDSEGMIRAHTDIEEFARHRDVVLMDNNVLAHPHGISQIEKIIELDLKVDFNQGIDARLIDDSVAKLLGKVKWLNPVRLACDHKSQVPSIAKAVELLRWHNVTPRRYFCYVLVEDLEDAIERVKFLKALNVDPFAQPFRDKDNNEPLKILKKFARWVNHKAEYNSRTWDEYLNNT